MTTEATGAHLPALAEDKRTEAGDLLQSTLVELVDLALTGKQLHWNIAGSGFREFHLQLDELVDEWQTLADTVAERAIALGHSVDGRPGTVAASSEVRPVEPGPTTVSEGLHELADRTIDVDQRLRGRIERIGEVDLASQDVLIEVLRTLEKQLWMLRAEVQ
jgi:starvation-inducible DNA-binding protein